jgi:hypothetical protein
LGASRRQHNRNNVAYRHLVLRCAAFKTESGWYPSTGRSPAPVSNLS